jgi:predicted Zn-dependent protease
VGAALLAAGCAWLAAGCATDPVTHERVANYYSLQDDIRLGQQTLVANSRQLSDAHVRANHDPAMVAKLNGMVRRIAAASDLPSLPYSVTLFDTNIVNAAAAPGGAMMVFEGLYDPKIGLVKDDDELAAVMAHEIAHVNCRHVTERLTKVMTAAAATEIGAIVADSQGEGKVADTLRVAFAVGTALWIPAYSRRDELEADRVGLTYMAKAGYDPRAAPRLWKRVYEKGGSSKDGASIFATHPSDRARYEALTPLVPQAMEEYRKAVGHYPPDYTPGVRFAP